MQKSKRWRTRAQPTSSQTEGTRLQTSKPNLSRLTTHHSPLTRPAPVPLPRDQPCCPADQKWPLRYAHSERTLLSVNRAARYWSAMALIQQPIVLQALSGERLQLPRPLSAMKPTEGTSELVMPIGNQNLGGPRNVQCLVWTLDGQRPKFLDNFHMRRNRGDGGTSPPPPAQKSELVRPPKKSRFLQILLRCLPKFYII